MLTSKAGSSILYLPHLFLLPPSFGIRWELATLENNIFLLMNDIYTTNKSRMGAAAHMYPYVPWCVGRSFGLDHTCEFKSCIVRVMRFIKILCRAVDNPNAPKSAPGHEFYWFKWAGSMITWNPFVHKKEEVVVCLFVYHICLVCCYEQYPCNRCIFINLSLVLCKNNGHESCSLIVWHFLIFSIKIFMVQIPLTLIVTIEKKFYVLLRKYFCPYL